MCVPCFRVSSLVPSHQQANPRKPVIAIKNVTVIISCNIIRGGPISSSTLSGCCPDDSALITSHPKSVDSLLNLTCSGDVTLAMLVQRLQHMQCN